MKRANKKIGIIFITLILALACTSITAGAANLPSDLIMHDGFKAGYGASVGKILRVQGEAVIMHADQKEGYWARRDYPLYKGDLVVTKPEGRVRLELIDESKLTLSSDTKIEISESLYSRKKKSRFSFIRMAIGKARFVVKRLADLRRSRFKVRTSTAVIGVRGTEFIVIAEADRTIVYSVKDPIEVISLVDPEKPVQMLDGQKVIILEDMLPSDPVPIDPTELQKLQQFFIIGAVSGEGPSRIGVERKPTGEKGGDTGTDSGGGLQPQVFSKDPGGFLVPKEELVEPTGFDEPDQPDEVITPEVIQEIVQAEQISEIMQQNDVIKENLQENIEELPDFPDLP